VEAEEKAPAGIIIPDTAKEKPVEGEVLAVGPGARDETGRIISLDVKTGDRVLFGKWAGTDVIIDGEGERAEEAVQGLRGVRGVTNKIEVRPQVPPVEIKRRIEQALRRAAELDASRLSIETNGSEIILRGTVRSWAEREQAERTARSAPGVSKVDNRIRVEG